MERGKGRGMMVGWVDGWMGLERVGEQLSIPSEFFKLSVVLDNYKPRSSPFRGSWCLFRGGNASDNYPPPPHKFPRTRKHPSSRTIPPIISSGIRRRVFIDAMKGGRVSSFD